VTNAAAIEVPAGSERLAVSIIQSALKTISVTETVWQLNLQRLGITRESS